MADTRPDQALTFTADHAPGQLAQRVDGDWIDPDSGEPATYPVPDPSEGYPWTVDHLRHFRASARGPVDAEPNDVQEQAVADLREQERLQQAERDRAQAALLEQEPGNVDDGVAHFVRRIADREVCGGCGQDWPCDPATVLFRAAEPATTPVVDQHTAEQAALLGVDAAALAAFLEAQRS